MEVANQTGTDEQVAVCHAVVIMSERLSLVAYDSWRYLPHFLQQLKPTISYVAKAASRVKNAFISHLYCLQLPHKQQTACRRVFLIYKRT